MKYYICTMDGLEALDWVVEAESIQHIIDEWFPGDELRHDDGSHGKGGPGRRGAVLFDPEMGRAWATVEPVDGGTSTQGLVHKTSTTGWCQRRPVRVKHIERGQVIHTERTGIIFVPLKPTGGLSWDCQVVAGTATYPPNGYKLSVGEEELKRGTLITPEQLRGLVP